MNQFLKRTFRTLNKPSEGRKTFQPLGEPTRLSTSIFCEKTRMPTNHWILPWFMLVRIMYIMLNHVDC
ncbi:hypothetical protein GBS27_20090 [Escherichia coli]|nr:hypothetical protein [Escherichia coli]